MKHKIAIRVALLCSISLPILRSGLQGALPEEEAVRPVPRTDQNSLLAHADLQAKAQKGGIDLYFEGDSITRRWGATDYPKLLENWKENFFGWNAADFAWGGDTTRNVLWRLDDGELDGVHPKVIVLLAGTNDLFGLRPGGEDAMVAGVTAGIRAILEVMREKAPEATVILMGIMPRNDNMALVPVIRNINRNLEGLADGRKIRYLDINDKLADAEGVLFEGMTDPDKLHLALKGYQVWADALKPLLHELLGPPAKEDHAPPPTGNPAVSQ